MKRSFHGTTSYSRHKTMIRAIYNVHFLSNILHDFIDDIYNIYPLLCLSTDRIWVWILLIQSDFTRASMARPFMFVILKFSTFFSLD